MRTPTPRLTPKTGRVSTAVNRKLPRLQDLVAIKIGDRNLRGGDQIQPLVLVHIHLPLLVGQLTRRGGALGIHHNRREHLLVAICLRLLQEKIHQSAHQARHFTHIKRETRPRDFHAPRKINPRLKPRNLKMRQRVRKRTLRITPGRCHHILLLTLAHRDTRVRQIRDPQKRFLKGLVCRLRRGLQFLRFRRDTLHFLHLFQKFR